eukprot:scaffold107183_cov51-Phaeocystis_antarctica.AAC.1
MTATARRHTCCSCTARAACMCSATLSTLPALSTTERSPSMRRTRCERPEWLRGYCPLSRRCRSSRSLSMKALTAAGVDTMTARSATAVCAFSSSSGVTWARLSKERVGPGLGWGLGLGLGVR